MSGRYYKCWITACSDAVPGEYVPFSFRKWAALATVSGALQRRIWYDHGDWQAYPNLYVVLVAPPGQGKGVAFDIPVDKVLRKLSEPIVGKDPDKMWVRYLGEWEYPRHIMGGKITYEDMCRVMNKFTVKVEGSGVPPYYDSSIFIRNSEFGHFMNRYDQKLHMLLTEGWDSKNAHEYLTKNAGNDIIKGPTISWLGAATQKEFVDHMPANANKQGLLSRVLPIVEMRAASEMTLEELPAEPEEVENLAIELGKIANLKGRFCFSDEAKKVVRAWLKNGQEPRPADPLLEEYCSRRFSHLLKMSMCFSAASRSTKIIELQDWESAFSMLIDAEKYMPDLMRRFGMSDAGRLSDDLVELVKKKGTMPIGQLRRHALRMSKNIGDIERNIELLVDSGALKRVDDVIKYGAGL